jgi:hypothetical protein
MSVRWVTIVLGLGVSLTACGSEDADSRPAPAASTPGPSGPAAVAEAYAHAVGAKDWAAVCATRTPSERADLAATAGSCERAFAAIFDGKPVAVMSTVRGRNVRVRGQVAGIDLVQPGQTRALARIAAIRVSGRWLLQDIEDAKIP